MRRFIESIKTFAIDNGIKYSEEYFTNDEKVIQVRLGDQKNVLHLIFVEIAGVFLACDISSERLPREIYPDELTKDITSIARNNEILDNAKNLLKKITVFIPQPGFFNRDKGYIQIPIEGKLTKIKLHDNFFDLPTAAKSLGLDK